MSSTGSSNKTQNTDHEGGGGGGGSAASTTPLVTHALANASIVGQWRLWLSWQPPTTLLGGSVS